MHFFFKQKKQCIITYPFRNPGFLKILNIKGNAILTIIYGTQLIWIIFLPLHTCCTLSQSLGHSGEEGACLCYSFLLEKWLLLTKWTPNPKAQRLWKGPEGRTRQCRAFLVPWHSEAWVKNNKPRLSGARFPPHFLPLGKISSQNERWGTDYLGRRWSHYHWRCSRNM